MPLTKPVYLPFLDIIRASACFLVVLLHVSAIHFYELNENWPIFLVYDSISRMCVPLFFMLSGFLLLDSDINSLRKFYYKRYLRIVFPFALICVFYYFTDIYASFTLIEYIYFILNFHVDYHLWYIYTLIGLFLALPFFIKIIHGQNGVKLAWLYVCIWVVAFVLFTPIFRYFRFENEILPNINFVFPNGGMEYLAYELSPNIFINFNLFPFFFGFMGYMLCGWHIKRLYRYFNTYFYIFNAVLFLAATVCIVFFTRRFCTELARPNELFFENLSPFVFFQSISFFILCTACKYAPLWIRKIARLSFWIYLIHLIWLRFISGIWPLPGNFWAILAVPAITLATFIMSALSALPLFKLEAHLLGKRKQSGLGQADKIG